MARAGGEYKKDSVVIVTVVTDNRVDELMIFYRMAEKKWNSFNV